MRGSHLFGGGYYLVGAHHFVVLVLQDVAVPDVAAGEAFEGDDDARDHAGVGAHSVLPAALRGGGGNCGPGETYRSLVLELEGVERPAVEYLKADQVQMDGVRILG